MENKHTGDVEFALAGKTLRLNYDFTAIAEIETKFGTANLSEHFQKPKVDFVVDMLQIGLRRNHPNVTREEIVQASPPVMPALRLIDRALNAAMFGPEGVPKQKEEGAAAATEKKASRKKA